MSATSVNLDPAFEEELRQVQAALRPSEMGARIAAILDDGRGDEGRYESARHRRHHCDILDVKYRPGKECSILYRLDGRLVLGRLAWGERRGQGSVGASVPGLGMDVYPFPHDPALPGLESALNEATIAAALAEVLDECRSGDAHILRARVAPVRYRPGRRCTVRIALSLRDGTGAIVRRTLFGKVYHDVGKAASVYEEMRVMSELAAVRAGLFSVAPTAGFLPAIPMVLQRPVSGIALDAFLPRSKGPATGSQPQGRDGLALAAQALAALHGSELTSRRQRPVEEELGKLGGRIRAIEHVSPDVGALMGRLVGELSRGLVKHAIWGAKDTVVHGDCKPSQFLIADGAVTLLDFDHCGMADPATDVGTFLASLRQSGALQAGGAAEVPEWVGELQGLFLGAYCRASGFDDGFRLRSAWYEALALLRKAERAFARSSRSPVPSVLLEHAFRLLGQLEEVGS